MEVLKATSAEIYSKVFVANIGIYASVSMYEEEDSKWVMGVYGCICGSGLYAGVHVW